MKTREASYHSTSTRSDRIKDLLPILLLVYLPIMAILILIKWQNRVPISSLTRDPLSTLNQPFYLGIISNLGILFWCSAAAICFFSYAVIPIETDQRSRKRFLLSSGIVTAILLLDDFFLFHEEICPKYLGIPENTIILGYLMMIFLYLLSFRKIILKTEFAPLLLALGWFGFSILIDAAIVPQLTAHISKESAMLVEDGSKLLGIASWFVYYTMVCREQIKYIKVQQTERSY